MLSLISRFRARHRCLSSALPMCHHLRLLHNIFWIPNGVFCVLETTGPSYSWTVGLGSSQPDRIVGIMATSSYENLWKLKIWRVLITLEKRLRAVGLAAEPVAWFFYLPLTPHRHLFVQRESALVRSRWLLFCYFLFCVITLRGAKHCSTYSLKLEPSANLFVVRHRT